MWKVLLVNEEEFFALLERTPKYPHYYDIKSPSHYPALFIEFGYKEYTYIYLEEFFSDDVKCLTIWKEKGSPLSYRRDHIDRTKWSFD